MATRIGVSDLIAASARYVRAQVTKANLNGNAYLTQAEALKLPADLRDNYDAYRKAGHSRVSVKQFVKSFTAHVAQSARAVDKNHDGFITATEAKKLPVDLRDNFLNYVKATQGPGPATDPVVTKGRQALSQYVAQVLFNTGNPEGAAFRTAVLEWRTPADQAAFRTQLEAEAAAWTPTQPGWEKLVDGSNTTYSGPFGQLYTEVRFKGTALPEVMVEID